MAEDHLPPSGLLAAAWSPVLVDDVRMYGCAPSSNFARTHARAYARNASYPPHPYIRTSLVPGGKQADPDVGAPLWAGDPALGDGEFAREAHGERLGGD